MKLRWCVLGLVLALCIAGGLVIAPGVHAADEGFTPLFNGKDLTGWKGDPRLWKVENGCIVGSTDGVKIEHNTFLFCDKQFSDFVLRAKVKLRNHNSGIQFRSEQRPDFVAAGYQADVAEKTYFGMLYEEQKRGILDYWKALSPEKQAEIFGYAKQGDWNEYEITCQGDHIKMALNGHVTVDMDDPAGAKSGFIALQLHAGPGMRVDFKDIEIKELPRKEAKLLPGQLMPDVDADRTQKLGVEGARYRLPDGFSLEEVAGDTLIGSVINLTFDPLGRPLIATENEGVRLLLDENGDGKFDKVKSVSEAVKRAMGLCYLGPGDLLVQSDGPQGPGVYHLVDKNGDDVADEVSQVIKAKTVGGMGEHAPHAIEFGPDGFLYIMYGNHSHPDFPVEKDSPNRGLDEDYALQRYWDARGHAKGVLAPGGTIERVSPNLKTMWQFCAGFRNAYDFAIDNTGEIFAFDSDMEWDIGLPWYRAVRVVHAVPGADYGWRSGSGKMPAYYADTLPPLDDVGRGSPVGTCIYDHTVYPEKFRGGYYMGDWSRGRIRVIFPRHKGATFTGKTVDFLVGEPLNVTDIDVAPDGLMYFTTGGRGTHGGMYRIEYGDAAAKPATPKTVEEVVTQPMRRSAWGRYAIEQAKRSIGKSWESGLTGIAKSKNAPAEQRIAALEVLQSHGPRPSVSILKKLSEDKDAGVRAFAVYLLGTEPLKVAKKPLTAALGDDDANVQRRACEALVRAGLDTGTRLGRHDAMVSKLLKLIDSNDRFVRYAARTALERTPRNLWADQVLALDLGEHPHAVTEGLLALVLTHKTAADMDAVFAKMTSSDAELSDEDLLPAMRVIELALIRDKEGADPSAFIHTIGPKLLAAFPTENPAVNREIEILLAKMEVPGAIDKLLAYQTPDKPQEEQIHTAYCLRTIKNGWTRDERDKFVAWFDRGREMAGGASFEGYIDFMWQDTLALLPDDEKKLATARKDAQIAKRDADALALLTKLQQEQGGKASELAQMSPQEIKEYLEYDPMAYPKNDAEWKQSLETGKNVFIRSRCVNCHVFGTVGKGGGPDLSTVASRFRRADIVDALEEPSKVISDQYIGLEIGLSDLSTVTGMVVTEDAKTLTVIDATGKRVDIPKGEIESRKPATKSIMPEGLLNTMSLNELAALINFLEHGTQ